MDGELEVQIWDDERRACLMGVPTSQIKMSKVQGARHLALHALPVPGPGTVLFILTIHKHPA